MKLIITEKPSVAMQFSKALPDSFNRKNGYLQGNEYIITWCVGHLITMSYPEVYDEKYKKWSLDTIPFIPQKYLYEVIPSVEDQYKVVTKLLNQSDIDIIYYAGDSAREGEYIQRLVREYGGRNKNAKEKRIWIDSQTDEEILRGLREAKDLSEYDNLSDSGYLRAQEDYLFGINLSRALTLKYGDKFNAAAGFIRQKPIAVGRVMTFVLGMIVERERLIRNAKEIPFWGVSACINGTNLKTDWKSLEGSKYFESPCLLKDTAFKEKKYAEGLLSECNSIGSLSLIKKQITSEKKNPQMLFNLAELQDTCSTLFKISPSETLAIAQTLYENKLTTYPRVDANVLSTAVAKEIHKNILGLKGISEEIDSYVLQIQNTESYKNIINTKYVDDSKISDHYAIIPTGIGLENLCSLTDLEKEVYMVIIRRFLSIFYPSATYKKINCLFKCGTEFFPLSKKIMDTKGFLEIWNIDENSEELINQYNILCNLNENQTYNADFSLTEGKTSPPKRYNSGNLILAMQNAGQLIEDEDLRAQIKADGIGTSSTRAEIINKLIKNEYIELDKKTQIIRPLKPGELIYDIVNHTVPSLLNAKMTASWEKGLNAVERGTVSKDEYTAKINNYIATEVQRIKQGIEPGNLEQAFQQLAITYPNVVNTDTSPEQILCPVCGNLIRAFQWGYGCTNYKNGCKVSVGKIQYGRELPDAQIKKLLTKGYTDKIKGLKKKDGGTYDAKLKMDFTSGKISPYFEKKE